MAKETTQATFVSPFTHGLTYEEFLAGIPKGVTVREYCKGNLEDSEIEWIEAEINIFKNNKSK